MDKKNMQEKKVESIPDKVPSEIEKVLTLSDEKLLADAIITVLRKEKKNKK